MKKTTLAIFLILIASFLLVAGELFIPAVQEWIDRSDFAFFLPMAIFSGLGIVLFALAAKEEHSALRKFLMSAGAAAAGFLLFVVAHNALYALSSLAGASSSWGALCGFLHAAFFITAILICPAVFIIGVLGSIVLMLRNKRAPVERSL